MHFYDTIKSVIDRDGATCRNNNNFECPTILNAPWEEHFLKFFLNGSNRRVWQTDRQTDATKPIISPALRSIINRSKCTERYNIPSGPQRSNKSFTVMPKQLLCYAVTRFLCPNVLSASQEGGSPSIFVRGCMSQMILITVSSGKF